MAFPLSLEKQLFCRPRRAFTAILDIAAALALGPAVETSPAYLYGIGEENPPQAVRYCLAAVRLALKRGGAINIESTTCKPCA